MLFGSAVSESSEFQSEENYSETYLYGYIRRSATYQVLYFHRNQKENRWEARIKGTVYVPHPRSVQPTSSSEVWFCTEGESEFEKGQLYTAVYLNTKILDGEITLTFVRGHWGPRSGEVWVAEYGKYIPDKFGKSQPSEGHNCWVCRFKRQVHIGPGGNTYAVDLIREDPEAQKRFEAEEKARLEREAAAKVAEAALAEQNRLARERADREWRDLQNRLSTEEAAREKLEQESPDIAARLRKLERVDRENDRPSLLFPATSQQPEVSKSRLPMPKMPKKLHGWG